VSDLITRPSGWKRWGTCTASPAATAGIKSDRTKDKDEGVIAHELHAISLTMGVSPLEFIGEVIDVPDAGESKITGEMAEYVEHSINYVLDHVNPDWIIATELLVDLNHVIPGKSGRADVVAHDAEKPYEIHLFDLKYGRGVKEMAERNGEVMLHALGVIEALPKSQRKYVDKVIIHITQPRLGHFDSWETDKKELAKFADEVREKYAEVHDPKRRKFVPSVQGCQFCDIKKDCKKLKESIYSKVVLGVDALGGVELKDPDRMDEHELAEMWDWLDFISAWTKNVKEHMTKAAIKGTQYPGLKVVEGQASAREWKDEEEAIKFMQSKNLEDFEMYNQTLRTAPQIEKQLGKKNCGDEFKALVTQKPGSPKLVKESEPGTPLKEARINEFDDL
jgi:hypothetical protein